ncbi:MAG: PP2C family protein-serine/threonine phosphatase, partial [Bacteroidota bacterium]
MMIIADGMGGLNAGEMASAITIDTFHKNFQQNNNDFFRSQNDIQSSIKSCLEKVQINISAHVKNNPETKGMGTTLVIACIKDNILHTAWIGDSRCYVFRDNKDLFFATKDHSYVQELIDSGKITHQQAFYHPESNIITRSLGGGVDFDLKPDFCSFQLKQGDRILICSDGLNGMLQDDYIASVLQEQQDINLCAKKLIDEANIAGGHDNITLILCDIISIEPVKTEYVPHLLELKHAATCKSSIGSTINSLGSADPLKKSTLKKIFSEQKAILFSVIAFLLMAGFFFSGILNKGSDIRPPVEDSTLRKDTLKKIDSGVKEIRKPVKDSLFHYYKPERQDSTGSLDDLYDDKEIIPEDKNQRTPTIIAPVVNKPKKSNETDTKKKAEPVKNKLTPIREMTIINDSSATP